MSISNSNDKAPLLVISASAGSGKTYNLVLEYLKLIIAEPKVFSHIMAITFTNKAASEMKDRILLRLSELAEGTADENITNAMIDVLKRRYKTQNEVFLHEKVHDHAQQCLKQILHDYSAFKISTIDSFTQRVIRTFAFDMNLSHNFEIELDFERIINNAVNNMINNAVYNESLSNFLTQYIRERVKSEENTNFDKHIELNAKLLENEKVQTILSNSDIAKQEIGDLLNIIITRKEIISQTTEQIKQLGKDSINLLIDNNIEPSKLYQGKRGICGFFEKAAQTPEDISVNKYHIETIYDDKWGKVSIDEHIKDTLRNNFHTINELLDNYKALLIEQENIYPLALINEVLKEIENIKEKENILPIAEFNNKINKIVKESEAPYIYERIGEYYSHYFIDEFQDTSELQWQNIIPLVENSMSKDKQNLIVGDAKQAIYRWRNGNVQQFIDLTNSKSERIKNSNLECNFRSGRKIVEFNNMLYKKIVGESNYINTEIKNAYETSEQKSVKKFDGYVEVSFYSDEKNNESNSTEFNINKIHEIIHDVTENFNYNLGNIAILCKTKNEAANIANSLIQAGINVVSPDSLLLKSSENVMFIVSIIRLLTGECCDIDMFYFVNYLCEHNIIKAQLDEIFTNRQKKSGNKNNSQQQHFQELKEISSKYGIALDWDKLILQPFYELVTNIIAYFRNISEKNCFNDIFVKQFLNYVFTFKEDLWQFPEWFDRKKSQLCVNTSNSDNAVQIMTIHKSKGLEFPIVICPNANYDIKANMRDIHLVANPKYQPENNSELPFYLIKYSKKSLETIEKYKDYYEHETSQRIFDDTNLLYVATTRATHQLYIITKKIIKKDKSDNSFNVNILLNELCGNQENDGDITISFGQKEMKVTQNGGNIHGNEENIDVNNCNSTNSSWREKIEIAESPGKIDSKADESEEIIWGKIVHEIFSCMNKPSEIDIAIPKIKTKYSISKEEEIKIREIAHQLLDDETTAHLLYDYDNIYNEREMINGNGEVFRTDRMMKKGAEFVIVDFKTGEERDSYKKQVTNYCKLVTEITGAKVTGYVLYCNHENHKLTCVFSTPQTGI